jgi:hypothetical protein
MASNQQFAQDLMPGYSQAIVKSVLSGDTVVLANLNNPKQERTLSLAFVSAPRLKREGDEVSTHLFDFNLHLGYYLSHGCRLNLQRADLPTLMRYPLRSASRTLTNECTP